MLDALDRFSRDSTLFQFTNRRLRDFIDPKHLLIQIDEQFDFPKLVEPLEEYYCRDQCRPAIHPEVLVRALLISSLYNITSFRRLCSAISESIVFRWFCFLTIDDKVFDHSTISYLIERVGNEGFGEIFQLFNEELLRLGLLSRKVYADSSLVRANVSGHDLSPSGMTVEEFREKAVEENGLLIVREQQADEDGVVRESVSYYQDPKGRLPLSQVDTDARWQSTRHDRRPNLHYQENAIVDRGGFIVARKATHASEGDWRPLIGMLDQLPVRPESLAADTGYNDGRLKEASEGPGHHGIHPGPSEPREEHGDQGWLRLPRRPPGVFGGQAIGQRGPDQERPTIPVCSSSEGLPAVSCQYRVPTEGTEATVRVPEHVLPVVPGGERAQQERIVPRGDGHTADNCRGSVRIAGPLRLGKKQVAPTVEGGL